MPKYQRAGVFRIPFKILFVVVSARYFKYCSSSIFLGASIEAFLFLSRCPFMGAHLLGRFPKNPYLCYMTITYTHSSDKLHCGRFSFYGVDRLAILVTRAAQ